MWRRRIARLTCSTRRHLLPLLPSGPDGVRNPPLHRARLSVLGGERGIRTPGTPLGAYTRFPVVLLQPLGHLSEFLPWSGFRLRFRPDFGLPVKPPRGDRRKTASQAANHLSRACIHPRMCRMAERGGFEPPWELVAPKSISSRSRYDHFGISPRISCHSERAADDIRFSLKNPLKISAQISF